MKTIYNKMAVKMNTWTNAGVVALIEDMGSDEYWKQYVNDSDRVYASNRSLFLTDDARMYDAEAAKYANPTELVNGEIVMLEANGKMYKVVDMTSGKWEYLSDPIHFELMN